MNQSGEKRGTRADARLLLAGLAAAFACSVTGCGKRDEPGNPAPAASPQAVTNAAARAATPEPDLAEITRNLRRWIVRNQRPPKNFEDFAATANVPIPSPPEGKKYAIDSTMHVILVKR